MLVLDFWLVSHFDHPANVVLDVCASLPPLRKDGEPDFDGLT